ncbi:MAG: hypothetical protein KC731_37740 [Myxococcales bacterium]|nr:hypothetical protein [Myxococcales bacterium]
MTDTTDPVPSWIAPRRPQKEGASPWAKPGAEPGEPSEPPEEDEPALPPPPRLPRSAGPAVPIPPPAVVVLSEPPTPSVDLAALEAEHQAEIAELEAQIRGLVSQLEATRRQVLVDAEPEVVRLAVAVAEVVAGRELSLDVGLVELWVREALQGLGDDDQVEVVVAPDLHARLGATSWPIDDERTLTPKVDPGLPAGGCQVRGRFAVVDASLKARLAALVAELDLEVE